MKINVDSFISLDQMLSDFTQVEERVKKYGEVIICRRDMPAFRLSAISEDKTEKLTLGEAMEKILSSSPEKRLHVKELTAQINELSLYRMKSGAPVSAVQVRARASGTPEKFECEKGNYVKLIENAQ